MPVIGHPWRPGNTVPRQFSRLVVSSTQLLSLFSTAVTLVPGVSGYFYIPRFVHLVKDAGTAYTLNGSTAIGIYHGSVAGLAVATVNPVGFMDQTGQLTAFASGPNALTVPYGSFTAAQITAANGAALVIANAVANLTVGTGNLTVLCVYEVWPMTFAFN